MMRLLFQGDLPLTITVALAAAVAAGLFWFYRRETSVLAQPLSWVLPLLRGAAIFLTLLMLAGPVLQHRTVTGNIPRVDVYIDASGSMLATDPIALQTALSADPLAAEATGASPSPSETSSFSPALIRPTRLQRASEVVLGGSPDSSWLQSVRSTHDVYLHALVGNNARLIWESRSGLPVPDSLELDGPPSPLTNLSDPIAAGVLGAAAGVLGAAAGAEPGQDRAGSGDTPGSQDADAAASGGGPRRAVLLLSDGQHNAGSPPQPLAQRLGDASIALYAIGVGSPVEPKDVAVLGVEAPGSVSASGRATGSITIKDLAGEGESLRLRILLGDQTVWQQTLTSEHQLVRRIPFDFSVAPWVNHVRGRDAAGIERTRVTLPLRAVIDPSPGEYDAGNNEHTFRLAANLRQRRLLIVDSRARWETRYLRNLFDRDPTWQVQTVLASRRSSTGDLHLSEGTFPADSQTMASFDAVIWGDVGAEAFSSDELRRLREFASQGGAVVFIDGNRDALLGLSGSPIGPLLPVRLDDGPLVASIRSLVPTTIGDQQAALRLTSNGQGDAAGGGDENRTLWSQLPPPTTLRRARVMPGSEVWLEATTSDSDAPLPVLVTRLFGGGQIVYLATDQTWRWRYRVADRYHARFWNQLLEAIMQPPFEVRDQYVALTTGAPQYIAGEAALIRVRLRDGDGQNVGNAIVEAVMQDQDGGSQTVLLHSVDADRGVYEARTGPLAEGQYEVSVRAAGYHSSGAVKTSLLVVPPPDRETARLAVNAELLQSMAEASGGLYASEDNANEVLRAIAPLSDGRIEIRRFAIAQSFVWFFAVLGLLTAEWWLRKKAGLV